MKKICLTFLFSLVLSSGVLLSCSTEALQTPGTNARSFTAPTLTDSPVPVSSPTALLAWQDAYAEFLRENIPISEVDLDALAEASDEEVRFGAFLAGGYPIKPLFYLYDIDNDGIPELIYIDAETSYDADVYSYQNNSISKIGSIKFSPFGGLGAPTDKGEGLYSDIGYKRHSGEIYFYDLNSGVLSGQMVLEFNNQPEISMSEPGLPYSFDNFAWLDYHEVAEETIEKVIYGGIWGHHT